MLTDGEIDALLNEAKALPEDYVQRLAPRPKRGHKEVQFDVRGEKGSEFRVLVRQSELNSLDFSVVLAYRIPRSNQLIRLRRYNGKSHQHTNPIEVEAFYDFHVHQATERYQLGGYREDTYAAPTDRYSTLRGAIGCLIAECAFKPPPDRQMDLFDEMGST